MNNRKGKALILGSEYVGSGDETLGYSIMMTFLESIVNREDKPKAIIFWNTAVKLLAEGSPTVPYLKALEEKGVQLLAGRFCLTDLCIADKIAVGKAVSMDEILDVILNNETISL